MPFFLSLRRARRSLVSELTRRMTDWIRTAPCASKSPGKSTIRFHSRSYEACISDSFSTDQRLERGDVVGVIVTTGASRKGETAIAASSEVQVRSKLSRVVSSTGERSANPNGGFVYGQDQNDALSWQMKDPGQQESKAGSIGKQSGTRQTHWVCALTALAFSFGVSCWNLNQGWFPHDEGQLGQAAERVLQGQLPHRDFDEMYTGGLSFLNALSFQLFGVHSQSMRWMLLLWSLPFVGAVYWLAAQIAKPVTCLVITLLAAVWSIPMYSAAMPSWYNLFFACWATCGLVAFQKTGQRRWLLAVGVLIGCSTLFKISGLYVLAAVLLFLVFRHQENRFQPSRQTRASGAKMPLSVSRAWAVFMTVGLCGASAISLVFVNQHDFAMQCFHFVIPFLCLTGFVIHREWKTLSCNSYAAVARLVIDCAAVVAAVALPVGIFVAYFVQHDALSELVNGTLYSPGKRVDFAASPFPAVASLVFSLPILALLFPRIAGSVIEKRTERNLLIGVSVIAALLLLCRYTDFGFNATFFSFRNLAPFLVIGNVILISSRVSRDPAQRQQLFLLTAVPFFVSLVQFPFAAPIYFFYAAPLLLLSALAAVEFQLWVPKRVLCAFALFLCAFSCLRFHSFLPGFCIKSDYRPVASARLNMRRSTILIEEKNAEAFNRLQEIVQKRTNETDIVFSTPDSPEVSFLTERLSMNGVMYEFFRQGIYDDHDRLRQQLEENDVNLVVIKEHPDFSPPVGEAFREEALEDFRLIEEIKIERAEQSYHVFSIYERFPERSKSQPVAKPEFSDRNYQ